DLEVDDGRAAVQTAADRAVEVRARLRLEVRIAEAAGRVDREQFVGIGIAERGAGGGAREEGPGEVVLAGDVPRGMRFAGGRRVVANTGRQREVAHQVVVR